MIRLYELEKKKDIDTLIEVLRNSKSQAVRARAAEILGDIGGERAYKELISILINEDEDEEVRNAAAKSIAWADEKALRMLLEKLEGRKIKGATWVLVDRLIKTLKSDDASIRMNSAIALGRLGDTRCLPHLIDALEDEAPEVRRAAAMALGMLGNSAAVDALVERLKDENVEVRKAALEALADMEIADEVDEIAEALKDSDARVRELAAIVLEKGGEAAVDYLLEAMKDPVRDVRIAAIQALMGCLSRVPPARSEAVRKKISEGLTEVKDIADVIIDVLDKTENAAIRKNAIWLLGQLGDPKGLPQLLKALEFGKAEERRLAATSLVKMGSKAVEPLLDMIRHNDEEIRRLVCWILGEIGDIRAKEHLNLALEDPSDRVRSMAFQALNKIKRAEKLKRAIS
ncbi:HEAT repeat domain-containing protein [Archaeoglobus veneficus]|uniref:PBS lyase HEAT domain protein repeat-containing protein n=1 Tax=Archaeoglobus veneficus (strain DSM 11195 / SNP6) TaxID=693661 RepID=F2KP68_ARCVS|nr:HEAT repeat domain-containing protein [Archaeoglobus veneficus]AEA47472.1 PBS lyase HEAT domain protein repeat-containing protein [Archaeoglobus veneficus SNP6]